MDPSQILNQMLASAGISASQLPSGADFSPGNIARAILILIVVYIAARILRRFLSGALKRTSIDPRVTSFLLALAYYGIIALGIIWVLGGFGLSIVVLGVALGFALKDLIQNFAAGLLIMGTRPFHPGDWISVGGSEGRVAEIGWRGTFIDAFDGRRIIVPNSNIITSVVINNSLKSQLRSTITISVDLNADFDRVEQTILTALNAVQGIATDPPPTVYIDSLSGNAMIVIVGMWIQDPVLQQRKVMSAAFRALKEALRANDIDLNPATSVVMSKN